MAVLLGGYSPGWELYVEDVSQINLYKLLMKAAIGRDLPKWFPIPLNGRQQVIDRARALSGKTDKRRLFLIDGDLSLLSGDSTNRISSLYRINAYCIENIVLEEKAISQVVSEHTSSVCPEDVPSLCKFEELSLTAKKYILPLFILFAVAKKLAPETPTVSTKIGRIYDSTNLCIRRDQLKIVRKTIIKECVNNANMEKFRSKEKEIRSKISSIHWEKYISGKDYLLPLFHTHCNAYTKYSAGRPQLARSLARHCTFIKDPGLKRRLRKLYGFSR